MLQRPEQNKYWNYQRVVFYLSVFSGLLGGILVYFNFNRFTLVERFSFLIYLLSGPILGLIIFTVLYIVSAVLGKKRLQLVHFSPTFFWAIGAGLVTPFLLGFFILLFRAVR